MVDINSHTEKNKRFEELKNYHQQYVAAFRDLTDYIDPTRGIYNGDRSRIGKMIDHKKLLDSAGTFAKRITASGLQTGLTDQTRPWFKLTLDNILIQQDDEVGRWLDTTTNRMIDVLNKSNMYKIFQNCYDELVQFGTGCFIILEDYDDVIRGKSFTAGEYYLGVDNKGRINAFARDFEMTVGQLVNEFGLESCSSQVQSHYKNNQLEVAIKVRHLIEQNRKSTTPEKAFISCYWEAGRGDEGFLAIRYFRKFPVVAPRWDCPTTEFVYGYGPGWHALGDIKELQMVHRDMLIAQEKYYNPPMLQDATVENHTNILPGGVTKISGSMNNSGVRPAYQINPAIEGFRASINDLHNKINKHLFADIFLMISTMDRNNITAFEVAKREQEKMMMLGPVLHNLSEEMLDVVIDLVFDIMMDNGLIPEPPESIRGVELKVQYTSVLAQAQKMVGIDQIRNAVAFVGEASAIWPEAKDNIDIDSAVRDVALMSGAPTDILLNPQLVSANREAQLEQQNRMIMMQAADQAAGTAKKLGATKLEGDSMLDMIGSSIKKSRGE